MVKRHPEQEACLRQALGFRAVVAAAAAASNGSLSTYMPKSHSLLCEDAETFRRRMEAVSLLERRACREVIGGGGGDDTTARTTGGISTRSSSSSTIAASAAAAAVLKFACRASAACRFCVQAQQVTIRGMTGWKIVRSQAHSCSEQEHAQHNLCSEKSLVYFFRNELPWVTLHCDGEQQQQDWTTLTQQFAAHLQSKYGIDYACGSAIRLRMLRRVLQQLTLRVTTAHSSNSDRTQSPKTVVLENLPSHATTAAAAAARGVTSTSTTATTSGMKRSSTTTATRTVINTSSTPTTATITETSAIALRTRRKLDHSTVAATASTAAATAVAPTTSKTALKRKAPPQSPRRASKRSHTQTHEEKPAVETQHVVITRSQSTLKRKAPPQPPTRAIKRSRTLTNNKEESASSETHVVATRSQSSQKQSTHEQQPQPPPKMQEDTTSNDAASLRRSLRRGAVRKQFVATAAVARDNRHNKRSNDAAKETVEATMQPVRKSQRVRTPSKRLQESLSTAAAAAASKPTRATASSPKTSQRVLRSRTTRETPRTKNDERILIPANDDKDSPQAPAGPEKTPAQILSVDEFLCDYDTRASSQGHLYYPLHLTGLSSSEALEVVRETLEELETQKKKLRAPPPPIEKQVEDDMREYRRSLKSLSVLRENEMLMRHKEREQDEQAYTQQRFFNRKQKKTPLALEVAAMADRPLWWVNNSEFLRAASRKCCLTTTAPAAAAGGTTITCPLCSRPPPAIMMTTTTTTANSAPPITLVPRIRQVDLDELEEEEEDDEGEEGSRENSSSNDDRRASRAAEKHAKVHATCTALGELEASLAFVDNYNKTSFLFGPK